MAEEEERHRKENLEMCGWTGTPADTKHVI
jgi:hypothetical protein